MSSVKPATTLVFDSFSGNSLVYLIVLFRQKFPLVSVIVVVGLANLSCCCDHCMNVANKPDKKMWKEIILFWSHVTSVFQGLSLSLRRTGRREPWERGCGHVSLQKHPFLHTFRRWGRFARRNVCDSAIEIPYWWRKICQKSGQKRRLVQGVVTLF